MTSLQIGQFFFAAILPVCLFLPKSQNLLCILIADLSTIPGSVLSRGLGVVMLMVGSEKFPDLVNSVIFAAAVKQAARILVHRKCQLGFGILKMSEFGNLCYVRNVQTLFTQMLVLILFNFYKHCGTNGANYHSAYHCN